MHTDFAWRGAGSAFGLEGATPVAPGRPAWEQVERAREQLATSPPGWVVAGALPFDTTAPAVLWLGRPEPLPPAAPPALRSGGTVVEEPRGRDDFVRAIARALEVIAAGECTKVVLSRVVEVLMDADISAPELLDRLAADPGATAFACRLPAGALVGASPEVLVHKRGVQVLSAPLAGSAPRSPDAGRDREVAQALLASPKARWEHAVVVDDILDRLTALGAEPRAGAQHLVATQTVWHLRTEISAQLADRDRADSLDVVRRLHPTAAVAGAPRHAALAAIHELEHRDRGFYTGAVGWQDSSGDGEWRVVLRAARVLGRRALLDVGAGVVAGSEPEAELRETDVKLQAVLGALGITAASA